MCDLLGVGVGWSGAVLHVFDMKRAYEEILFRFSQTPSLDAAIDMQLYVPNHLSVGLSYLSRLLELRLTKWMLVQAFINHYF